MGLIQPIMKHLEQLLVLPGFCDAVWPECRCEGKEIGDRGVRNSSTFSS